MHVLKMNPIATGHFGIKWHNMAKPAMNNWLMKGNVRFVEILMVSKFSNIMN